MKIRDVKCPYCGEEQNIDHTLKYNCDKDEWE